MFERFTGIFLIGIVIKLMDDYLDKDIDNLIGKWNITLILKNGIVPYTLVLLIIALSLNFKEGTAYFFSSYILGMAYDISKTLPSRLNAWQESIIIFILASIITTIETIIISILFVFFLQIIDDILDIKNDIYIKKNNYIIILGKVNTIIILLILLLLFLSCFIVKFLYFITAVFSVYLLFYIIEKYFNRNDIYVN
ncbi:MAG: hypothetical protein ACOCRK_02830 [bacterium]